MTGWIKMPFGTEVGLGAGDIVLDGDPALPQKGHSLPIFGPCLLWPNGRPSYFVTTADLLYDMVYVCRAF